MGKKKSPSRTVGDTPTPPITKRSLNPAIIDDNIAKLEKAIKAGDVTPNPSGTSEETLLTTIGIDGKKYDIGANAENVSYDNTDSGLIADDTQGAIDELLGEVKYKAGDTVSILGTNAISGYIITATTARFTIPLSKDATGLTPTITFEGSVNVATVGGVVRLDNFVITSASVSPIGVTFIASFDAITATVVTPIIVAKDLLITFS